MKFHALATPLLAAALAPAAVAMPVVFNDFNSNGPTFIEGQASASDTVDGVTLTMAVGNAGDLFNSTGGGTGIDVGGDNAGNERLGISDGEPLSLSFDADGTFSLLRLGSFNGDQVTITYENENTGVTTSNSFTGAGFTGGAAVLNPGLSVSANDVIQLSVAVAAGGRDVRIQEIQFSPVPEPASLALFGAGAAVLLRRRRTVG